MNVFTATRFMRHSEEKYVKKRAATGTKRPARASMKSRMSRMPKPFAATWLGVVAHGLIERSQCGHALRWICGLGRLNWLGCMLPLTGLIGTLLSA